MSCYGCKCNYCLYSVEKSPDYFTQGEVTDADDLCFCCDDCREYDGDRKKSRQWRDECEKHKYPVKYIKYLRVLADEKAQRQRAAFRVIKKSDENE